jgi:nitroimidazol reductase NimA-like FMN-containing flavoprotein (pyridoxamine 5'-phosphate oxidase superfamily)
MQRTARTAVRRSPERGVYDTETIYAILDAGFLCHVGFVQDAQPFVVPTLYARVEERLYLHGSPRSRLLQSVEGGLPVCITVTHVDGLVLARSAFHHSINYRSVMVLGRGQIVGDPGEKEAALTALVEHIVPGRSEAVRAPSAREMKATGVLVLPLQEASAKVRTGPPKDAYADYALPIWAGELPLRLEALTPVSDPRGASDLPVPEHVQRYRESVHGEWPVAHGS